MRSSSRGSTRGRRGGRSDDGGGKARRAGDRSDEAPRQGRGPVDAVHRPPAARPQGRGPRWIATVRRRRARGRAFAAAAWLFVLYPSSRGPGQGHGVEIVIVADPTPAGWPRRSRAPASSPVRASSRSGCAPRAAPAASSTGKHLLTDDASPRELMARLERRAVRRAPRTSRSPRAGTASTWRGASRSRQVVRSARLPRRDHRRRAPARARRRRRQRRGLPLSRDLRPAVRQRRRATSCGA